MPDNSNSRRVILGALLSLAPLKAAAQFQLPREAGDFLIARSVPARQEAFPPARR